ncbi:MAG: hypothetical protein KA184_18085, partial [Candidatus Hydrogenedentes bacterium]|nr:hypothetical protein [Candidatus Hydrogenedentota bacterium]
MKTSPARRPSHQVTPRIAVRVFLGVVALIAPSVTLATTNISLTAPYAWSGNGGWINARGDCFSGVVVTSSSLSGFAWSENTGWINFGDGTNTDPDAFGVVNDGAGNLSGFGW